MIKDFDFKNLYQNNYKKLPWVVFWSTLIIGVAGAITGAVFLFIEENIALGMLVLLFGPVVAFYWALLDRFWCATVISQKIVATDALLEMRGVNVRLPENSKKAEKDKGKKKSSDTIIIEAKHAPVTDNGESSDNWEDGLVDIICPNCREVLSVDFDQTVIECPFCEKEIKIKKK